MMTFISNEDCQMLIEQHMEKVTEAMMHERMGNHAEFERLQKEAAGIWQHIEDLEIEMGHS